MPDAIVTDAPAAPAAPVTDAPAPTVTDAPAPATTNLFAEPPENWRQSLLEVAGFEGDEVQKRASQLERVLNPGVLVKNYFSAQDRIRAGELSNGLPENPTPEQLADWRTAQGIPAAPTDYELSLEKGLVLGDEDVRIMAPVYEVAHKNNVPAKAMNDMVNAFLTARVAETDALVQQDGIDSQQATQALKKSWGSEYMININKAQGLISRLPDSVREAFEQARLADGRMVFNSPEVLVFFADIARELDPGGFVVPNSNNPTQAISDEIKALEARMGTKEWYADKEAQNRYMMLIEARDKMAQK